jgi:hypothetical protein
MRLRTFAGGVVLALCFGGTLFAQNPPSPPPDEESRPRHRRLGLRENFYSKKAPT